MRIERGWLGRNLNALKASLSLSLFLFLSPSLSLSFCFSFPPELPRFPGTAPSCLLQLSCPLISPSCPFHVSSFLMMSWSCPLPFLSTSPSCPCHFIFHVCAVLSLPVISLHLPSCPLVSLSFVSLSLHSLCFHFFPFMSLLAPLVSLSFPLAFLSCQPPICSARFPALPRVSLLLPSGLPSVSCQKHGFLVFAKGGQQTHIRLPRSTWDPPPKPYVSDVQS